MSTSATTASFPGAYPILIVQGTLSAPNYTLKFVNGTLTVNPTAPSPGPSGSCNGAYNGTFNGNITVSAGQTCIFMGGKITGDVQQRGGTLVLNNTAVGGNVQVNGGGAFTIGAGTTIAGTLEMHGLPSGAGLNLVCGATVSGDVQFHNNGTAVQIGSTAASCPGNTIGGTLEVHLTGLNTLTGTNFVL